MSTSSLGVPPPRPRKHPVVTFKEKPRKHPVTQEVIAVHLGRQLPCLTAAEKHYPDALYRSVSNLVFKLAVKYQPTCPRSEANDMAQDCWVRIVRKLHTYNPKFRFTTWVYQVCSSVLNKSYRRAQRNHLRFAELPDGLDENMVSDSQDGVVDENFGAVMDLRGIIGELNRLYPEMIKMTEAILTDSNGYPNEDIVFRRAAIRCGSTPSRVARYFQDVVKPFFIQRLEGVRQ